MLVLGGRVVRVGGLVGARASSTNIMRLAGATLLEAPPLPPRHTIAHTYS